MTVNARPPTIRMIRVPRPRILWVRRHFPGRATPGDTAQTRLEPGIISLLDSPLGDGYQARYNIPVRLADTSAVAIVAPAAHGLEWAGRDLEVEWSGVPNDRDAVLAEARLEEFADYLARFAIEG